MFERLVRLEKRDIRRHDGKRNQRRSCIVCVWLIFLNEREREFGLMARHCINSYPGVAWVTHIALVILTLMTKVCGPFNLARTYLSIVLLCQFNGNSFDISVSD